MSFLWDDNPLAGLPEITPYPGQSESSSSSALSSLPASPIVQKTTTDVVNDILNDYQPIHASDDTAKVLRAFVDNLSGQGLATLQSEIYIFATDPRQLRQLRNFLTDALLKPMAAAGGKQPPVTPSPNKSAAFEIELAMTQIEGSSRTGQRSLKKECLSRDANRCVISGLIDEEAFSSMSPEKRKGTSVTTECAHILPFALSNLDGRNATQTKNRSTVWWALYRYFPALKNKIGADTINQPGNAITLASALHEQFGRFAFVFKATNEEHKYHMEILNDSSFYVVHMVPGSVVLPQEDAKVQRPDSDILDVHMRIGRILQVSGISSAIYQSFVRGRSCIYNIASDGSTDLERILSDKMLMRI
ncbi:uncharacterized protein C8A04DRAFT_10219 [Dichotomopilus funicola]|uniref:HNH nuclease domain-containing protein n=1 Tax=Dichotomopilus funicola TaxID=1934379 RepID=A0AAN6ZPT6_9PEZI|nr:hypothetical protein C8A04DRAFT_10219 [Dichotomopilus funicola]